MVGMSMRRNQFSGAAIQRMREVLTSKTGKRSSFHASLVFIDMR